MADFLERIEGELAWHREMGHKGSSFCGDLQALVDAHRALVEFYRQSPARVIPGCSCDLCKAIVRVQELLPDESVRA